MPTNAPEEIARDTLSDEQIAALKSSDMYTNRELSLLEFNWRVLQQASDPRVPLLERLKFLCISTTNMDEFFEIRVAGVKQRLEAGSVDAGPDGLGPQELLAAISERAHEVVTEQYEVLNDELLPALEAENIRFLRRDSWTEEQINWLRDYFEDELLPILSPIGLDPAHPFPRVLNKSLNFICQLSGKDAFGRSSGLAVVQAPRALPRLIQLPANVDGNGPYDFVFLSSVMHAFVEALFPGMSVEGFYQFRITRNSDLFVDEEEIDDLLRALEGELQSRRHGDVVRLEVAHNCPDDLVQYLLKKFELTEVDLYQNNGPVNLGRMMEVTDAMDRRDLSFAPFLPSLPKSVKQTASIFDAIAKRDILVHHPFESFLPVVEFIKQAALDPNTLAIKQTLYRTGAKSVIVDALVAAAAAGKEVTVVIELRARFDEQDNIQLANRLQEAGAHVTYGVVGYKTHAKMVLIVRREGKQLVHYAHFGTGNYHPHTARLYSDYGLFTCNENMADDALKVFRQLTSLGKAKKLRSLIQSPFSLHSALLEKIARERSLALSGKPGRVIIKVNSLTEPRSIQALYEASMAGVQIDLIVRGICMLKPGVINVSENIRVRSIIGRFLEHTRVYCFGNDGSPEIYCASADLMERNLFSRVEVGFPLEEKKVRDRVFRELDYYLSDNQQAWILGTDGRYKRAPLADGDEAISAQDKLLEELSDRC